MVFPIKVSGVGSLKPTNIFTFAPMSPMLYAVPYAAMLLRIRRICKFIDNGRSSFSREILFLGKGAGWAEGHGPGLSRDFGYPGRGRDSERSEPILLLVEGRLNPCGGYR